MTRGNLHAICLNALEKAVDSGSITSPVRLHIPIVSPGLT